LSEEQKIDKTKLPTKTKIALGWIYIISIAIVIAALVVLISVSNFEDAQGPVLFVTVCIAFPIWLLFLLPGILLPLKKRWSWITSIIIVSLEITGILGGCVYLATNVSVYLLQWSFFTIILFIPLILLVIDRKNYFEMLRQWVLKD
jgi:hypothetical protein